MFSEDQGCLNHQVAGTLFANKPADIIYCDLQKMTYPRPGLVLYTVNPVDQPLPSMVVKKGMSRGTSTEKHGVTI